jgi:hypothetical protein
MSHFSPLPSSSRGHGDEQQQQQQQQRSARISSLANEFRLALLENAAAETALKARISRSSIGGGGAKHVPACSTSPERAAATATATAGAPPAAAPTQSTQSQHSVDLEGLLPVDLVGHLNAFNANSSLRYGGYAQARSIYEPKDPCTTQASARWKYYPYYKTNKNPAFKQLCAHVGYSDFQIQPLTPWEAIRDNNNDNNVNNANSDDHQGSQPSWNQ